MDGPAPARLGHPARRALAALVSVAALAAGCSYTTDLALPERQAESSRIYWADGTLLTRVRAEIDREPIELEAMGDVLPLAVVAIEDERFYEHPGVDARSVVRALRRNVEKGEIVEGGSTITQQYVRAVLLGPEQDLERKVREAVLAVQLERRLSKPAILERYLNTVYFGNGAYGVQAAARLYFGSDPAQLDLAPAALLAGLIRAPETYNPHRDPAAALARRNAVLDRMAELDRASRDDVEAAKAQPLGVIPLAESARYPAAHFVDRVRELVLTDPAFGPDPDARRRTLLQGGLRIHTTLDPRLQVVAEQALSRVIVEPATDPAAALVSIDPRTGHVRAYVGGDDYFGPSSDAQYDLAGQARRSTGSSFKPFVLAAALEAGIPLDRTYPAPGSLEIPLPDGQRWKVDNYDGQGGGTMDLVESTVDSVNTVYAQLVFDVGAQAVVDLAATMGIRSPLGAFPSAALGSNLVTVLDMATAYAPFAADGVAVDPVIVTRVTTRDGTVLYEAPARHRRALPATTARTVTGVLRQVVERGTGVNARIGRPVAGKTGTGEEWGDAWFVGYTPELVTAVWVGFSDEVRTMRPPATRITVTGGSWPAQIWQLYTGAALAETPITDFPAPAPDPPPPTSSTTTTLPAPGIASVVGMRVEDATEVLVTAGYQVRTRPGPSRDYPPGVVVAQTPAAGARARPGATVTLTVADGPPSVVTVPTVLGAFGDEAATLLRALGLAVSVQVEPEPPPGGAGRAGRVWKQSPIGGAALDEGRTVTLWVNP